MYFQEGLVLRERNLDYKIFKNVLVLVFEAFPLSKSTQNLSALSLRYLFVTFEDLTQSTKL